jgi:hypothetical protein
MDQTATPRTVLSAKVVNLALVSFVDEKGRQITQLAIVGENNVHLLDSKEMGFRKETTPSGLATEWLKKGIFEKLSPTPAEEEAA